MFTDSLNAIHALIILLQLYDPEDISTTQHIVT
jgi:hypothetical protein